MRLPSFAPFLRCAAGLAALIALASVALGSGTAQAHDGTAGHVHCTDQGGGGTGPDAPTARAEPGPAEGQITLHWTPATTGALVTEWNPSSRKAATEDVFVGISISNAGARSHTFSNLDAGVAYDVTIRGFSGVVAGDIAQCDDVKAFDGTRPTYASATVDGTALTVTFSENLDTGSTPAGSQFSVRARPLDGTARTIAGTGTATISGMTASVTLASAVRAGEVVTVSYTKPTANPLQDGFGNDVESFTNKLVTNGTGLADDASDAPELKPADSVTVVWPDGTGSTYQVNDEPPAATASPRAVYQSGMYATVDLASKVIVYAGTSCGTPP